MDRKGTYHDLVINQVTIGDDPGNLVLNVFVVVTMRCCNDYQL